MTKIHKNIYETGLLIYLLYNILFLIFSIFLNKRYLGQINSHIVCVIAE